MRNLLIIIAVLICYSISFGQKLNCNVVYPYKDKIICNLKPLKVCADTFYSIVEDVCNSYDFDYSENGIWKVFLKDSINLIEIISIKNKKRNGESIEYFLNGKPKQVAVFLNDTLNGNFIKYNELGLITNKGIYKNGKFTGKIYKYWDNGKLAYELYQENDSFLSHNIKYWNKTGEKIDSREFKNNGIIVMNRQLEILNLIQFVFCRN